MNEKLKIYTDLFIHWDSNYWYSFYIFLFLQGSLIIAFSELFTSNVTCRISTIHLVCFIGIILSVIWILLLNRKMTYTKGSEDCLKDNNNVPEVWVFIGELQKKNLLARLKSSRLTDTGIPILFIGIWLLIGFTIN